MDSFTNLRTVNVYGVSNTTRRALGKAHVPPTKLFPRLTVNKAILKPCRPIPIGGIFPDVIEFCVAVHTILEKAIRFWLGIEPVIIGIGLKS